MTFSLSLSLFLLSGNSHGKPFNPFQPHCWEETEPENHVGVAEESCLPVWSPASSLFAGLEKPAPERPRPAARALGSEETWWILLGDWWRRERQADQATNHHRPETQQVCLKLLKSDHSYLSHLANVRKVIVRASDPELASTILPSSTQTTQSFTRPPARCLI